VVEASAVQLVETEVARATAELDRLVQQTLIAAREWGVRPDHLEGRFISMLLTTLTSLGLLTKAAAAQSQAASREHAVAAAAELKGLQAANKVAVALQVQAQSALASSEVKVDQVVSKFVMSVAPEIVKQISGAVVLRERRYNQSALWGRAVAIAAVACGLVLGGYTWRAWTPDPAAATGALLLERIRQCQAAPTFRQPQTGDALCNVKSLLAGS